MVSNVQQASMNMALRRECDKDSTITAISMNLLFVPPPQDFCRCLVRKLLDGVTFPQKNGPDSTVEGSGCLALQSRYELSASQNPSHRRRLCPLQLSYQQSHRWRGH